MWMYCLQTNKWGDDNYLDLEFCGEKKEKIYMCTVNIVFPQNE